MPDDERRLTLRLTDYDEENLSTIRDDTALKSDSEAVRLALKRFATIIRSRNRNRKTG